MTAIKSLFDLIHVYGLGAFEDAAEDECHNSDSENDKSSEAVERSDEGRDNRLEAESGAAEHSQSGWSKAASSLIAILSSTLDSEVRKALSAFHVHLPKVPCTSIVWRNVHFMFTCLKCPVLVLSGEMCVGDGLLQWETSVGAQYKVLVLVCCRMENCAAWWRGVWPNC